MRERAIIAEAGANARSGTTRLSVFVIAFVLLIGGLAAADTAVVSGILIDAEEFRISGAATYRVIAHNGIVGSRCEAVGRVGGSAQAGGALRQGEPIRASAMPDTRLPVWEVTSGVLDLLTHVAPHATESGAGVWITGDLAGNLGLAPGDTFHTDAGLAEVAGVFTWPDDGRTRDIGFSVLAPVPASGHFSQCWLHVWPADREVAHLLYTTVSGQQNNPEFGQLNTTLGIAFDALADLDGRLTRHVSAAAALAGILIGWAATRLRRLEIASALHARARKSDLMLQHVLEATTWIIPGLLIGAALIVGYSGMNQPEALPDLLRLSAFPLIAGAAGAVIGTIAAVAITRERHLFALFKSR
ncbi:MAG: hypothetical protein FWD83_10865 [Promicromonosporaceae bacterium]|nr:hypothetical protein [Promicromonosporaceae bacterium]